MDILTIVLGKDKDLFNHVFAVAEKQYDVRFLFGEDTRDILNLVKALRVKNVMGFGGCHNADLVYLLNYTHSLLLNPYITDQKFAWFWYGIPTGHDIRNPPNLFGYVHYAVYQLMAVRTPDLYLGYFRDYFELKLSANILTGE